MADQPKQGSKNIGKWIVIGAILIFITLFLIEGYKQGWINQNLLQTLSGYVKNQTFWINVLVIAGSLSIVGYFIPPFKDTLRNEKGDKSPYFLLALILAISIFAAIKLGNSLIYKEKFVAWLIPFDAAGNFNFKPLLNVSILWTFFCFVLPNLPLPHFQGPYQRFLQLEKSEQKAAPYVILLALSLLLAYQLGGAGIWEKQQFLDVEHFFLGERTAGGSLFDTHTGIYTNSNGETRYGILKTKVKGPDGDVFPIAVLGIVAAGLFLLTSFKLKELQNLGGWKTFFILAVAAAAANRGASLQGIITISYWAIVLFTREFIGRQVTTFSDGALKKYLPWIGAILVAEYTAEMINPLDSPPYFSGGVVGKTIFLAVIILLWNFVSNFYSHAAKAGLRFGICQNCGRPCKRKGTAYVCDTLGCPAGSCQEISGIDALSGSLGIRFGTAMRNWITGTIARNREEDDDVDAAEAAAGGAAPETPAERRARWEARRNEIGRMLENHRNGIHYLTVTEQNELEAELREIERELARGAP